MPPREYEALVHRWPLAWLYRWLLARHVDHFDKTVRQAIADHKTMKN